MRQSVLIALAVFAMIVIAAFDVPSMIKNQEWNELKVFGLLWTFGLVIGILQTMQIAMPNPTVYIIASARAIVDFASGLLGLTGA